MEGSGRTPVVGPARPHLRSAPPPPTGPGGGCGATPGRARPRRDRGVTLLEVATVLLLAALALSAAVPTARSFADRTAARAAREAVVGMVAAARAEAVAAGGATLGLDPAGDSLWVEAGGRVARALDLSRELGADLGPEGSGPVLLRFDPLGLGRLSSRTVTVGRGTVTLSLTLSAYGRVKRW